MEPPGVDVIQRRSVKKTFLKPDPAHPDSPAHPAAAHMLNRFENPFDICFPRTTPVQTGSADKGIFKMFPVGLQWSGAGGRSIRGLDCFST